MTNNLPSPREKLDVLETDLIGILESERMQGCNLAAIGEKSRAYAGAVRSLLGHNDGDSGPSAGGQFERFLPELESAYTGWKAINEAFESTIRMAYVNTVPRRNLLLDQTHADLIQTVGEPLAERYIHLKTRWCSHLADHPWDTFLNSSTTHVDSAPMDRCLNALIRGDDLDIEDAINHLSSDLRHAFIDFIETRPDNLVDIEPGLWKRPEILIASDFWGRGRQRRTIDALKHKASPRFAQAFGTLYSIFTFNHPAGAAYSSHAIADEMQKIPEDYRGRFFRCLLLHPDYELRRYALSNLNTASAWKALTPRYVPCATILSLLEQLVGSSRYNDTQRKIFFDTIYRRLLNVTSRSDVLYARGIVRILTKLNFFLEDDYFARIIVLLDYLEAKEKHFKIDDVTMRQYTDALKNEKQRVGNVETQKPEFNDVPLVILRKLARDGHFWDLLAMHPIVKIARETVPYVSTPERALAVARNHRTNQEVLRSVGKRHSLFPTAHARFALLGNPRTPPGVSMEYLPDFGRNDIERLLRQAGIHPELRTMLRHRYNRQE